MNELIDANTHLSIFEVEKLNTRYRTLRNFSLLCVEVKMAYSMYRYTIPSPF